MIALPLPNPLPFVDTHCHLDMVLGRLELPDLDSLFSTTPHGVPEAMVHVACHPKDFEQGRLLSEGHPRVWCAYGIHPHDATLLDGESLAQLRTHLAHPRTVAIGEMGLDYHYMHSPVEVQKTAFALQLELARELGFPAVIHTREADADTLEILGQHLWAGSRIHVHCFTGSADFVQKLLALPGQTFVGFTGILTFKSAGDIRDAARVVPLDRLLLETDAPFLAPEPWRGKIAVPGMALRTAEVLAQLRDLSLEELLAHCRNNSRAFYGI